MCLDSLRWLSLGTSDVKIEDADGSSEEVYNAGNVIAAFSGTGEGILGDLMVHLYGLSVWFVILIWYVAAISYVEVQRAHKLRAAKNSKLYFSFSLEDEHGGGYASTRDISKLSQWKQLEL